MTDGVPPRVVFGTCHYWEANNNELTNGEISAAKVIKSSVAEAQASIEAKRKFYMQEAELATVNAMHAHQWKDAAT